MTILDEIAEYVQLIRPSGFFLGGRYFFIKA